MKLVSRLALLWLILCLPNCLAANETGGAGRHDATSHRTFEDVEHWVKVFDDPERDEWQKPSEVVAALGLSPGSTVADLGAGTGYFSRYLSRAVGEHGTVFAVDVEARLIEHVRKRAELEKTPNVIPVLASANEPRLPYGSIDVVLIVDTYHHLNDRLTYLRRLARTLERGGRIVVIDWFERELPKGPPPAHKLPRKQVVEEMTTAGYELVGEPSILPYQYFLIFRRRR
jgi:ubiquinone/menaquinone biosynthesis C-methylase UbiE